MRLSWTGDMKVGDEKLGMIRRRGSKTPNPRRFCPQFYAAKASATSGKATDVPLSANMQKSYQGRFTTTSGGANDCAHVACGSFASVRVCPPSAALRP
jgi:hypothetical protein